MRWNALAAGMGLDEVDEHKRTKPGHTSTIAIDQYRIPRSPYVDIREDGMSACPTRDHADRVEAAILSGQAASSALIASWRRSSSVHQLDPAERRAPHYLSAPELQCARERAKQVVAAAQRSLDRLYRAAGGVGCCVLLADLDGVPMDRRGATADDDMFRSWGLWTGAVWSENCEGTNGIGTCLAEKRALTIHRDQHFFSRNTLLSCTAAPIHDHEGRLAGALDVSSCRADLTDAFIGLISLAVTDAVRLIEAELFRNAFPNSRILLAPTAELGSAGLLAVDGDDLVIGANRQARQALGITEEALSRHAVPVADLLGDQSPARESLGEAERGALQRALARSQGNVTAAALSLGISRATLHRKLGRLAVRPH